MGNCVGVRKKKPTNAPQQQKEQISGQKTLQNKNRDSIKQQQQQANHPEVAGVSNETHNNEIRSSQVEALKISDSDLHRQQQVRMEQQRKQVQAREKRRIQDEQKQRIAVRNSVGKQFVQYEDGIQDYQMLKRKKVQIGLQ